MEVHIETVKTDSFTMDYCRFGHGEKTLVMLPGLSVQSVMLLADVVADAFRMFADDYTVYLFDRRKVPPDPYSVYDMAKDTADAFRVRGLKEINLIGVSQGGLIAMEIASRQPDLIQKMVLASASACIEDEQYRLFDKWIRLARAGERTELYMAFGEAVYPDDVFEQLRGSLAEAAGTVSDEDLDRFIIMAESMKAVDIRNDLEKIACPVLVTGSMDDRVLGPDSAFEIVKHLRSQKGVALIMYDGYGHAAYDTAPDYRERVLSFFKGGE